MLLFVLSLSKDLQKMELVACLVPRSAAFSGMAGCVGPLPDGFLSLWGGKFFLF